MWWSVPIDGAVVPFTSFCLLGSRAGLRTALSSFHSFYTVVVSTRKTWKTNIMLSETAKKWVSQQNITTTDVAIKRVRRGQLTCKFFTVVSLNVTNISSSSSSSSFSSSSSSSFFKDFFLLDWFRVVDSVVLSLNDADCSYFLTQLCIAELISFSSCLFFSVYDYTKILILYECTCFFFFFKNK